jgi:hypothetical protein
MNKNSGSPEVDFGVTFRSTRSGTYYFSIDPETRKYQMGLVVDGDWHPMIGWTHSSRIETEGSNRVAVLGQGMLFTLFINEEEITSIDDEELSMGYVGLGMGFPAAGGKAELEFDNFDLTAPRSSG